MQIIVIPKIPPENWDLVRTAQRNSFELDEDNPERASIQMRDKVVILEVAV